MTGRSALRRGITAVGLAIPVAAVALFTGNPAYSSGDPLAAAQLELEQVSDTDCTVVATVLISPTALDDITLRAAVLPAVDSWLEADHIWVGSIDKVTLTLGGRIVSGDEDAQWVLVETGPSAYVQEFLRLDAPGRREVWLRADAIMAVPSEACTNPKQDF